ncbi:hypothetical protein [Reyranella sp.]|uniref:hypothetical protein n=1 Tax=Reyranella sp. TaxID=1929291 RepID=UPI0037848D36
MQSVHHWTDELFSFRTTRDKGFRFASGQLTMIGLEVDGKPLLRAYSIASAPYDDALDCFKAQIGSGSSTRRRTVATAGRGSRLSRRSRLQGQRACLPGDLM